MTQNRTYIAIDLKSFYASVECRELGLDPMTTNLVVADNSRTEKTICLAVSPSLKSYGIPGRPRLFEVVQKVKEANITRRSQNKGREFEGESVSKTELDANKNLAIDYLVAKPRMALYVEYSTRIYDIYLKYISPDDMHIYSIDEVFMDVTNYLDTYKMTAHDLAMTIIRDVLKTTGITATVGIGTNMYLAKIAMDIVAKRMKPDKDGVRVAEIDDKSYRELLWDHRPLTDFWRVGKGIAKKLEKKGIYTMGDVARCSLGSENEYYNEDLLYKMFGINAELLIDHAWGYEPCTIEEIKQYKPEVKSINSGQVLQEAYSFDKARIVAHEMTDLMVLDLVDKKLLTNQIVLTVGYDIENLQGERAKEYKGEIAVDAYGRKVPKHAHGTTNLLKYSSSSDEIIKAVLNLYDKIVDRNLTVRRVTVVANHLLREEDANKVPEQEQLDMFVGLGAASIGNSLKEEEGKSVEEIQQDLEKEKHVQQALLDIKKKYGKNAILKGMNLQKGATAKERNSQIGGHKA